MERAAARRDADHGRVRHRLHQHVHGRDGPPTTYDEYAQIMTGFTPEQVPVLSGIARDFGVFDHWFCEVPSQTFMNRSFWTAATSSGLVVNSPVKKWLDRERCGDDLRAAGGPRQDVEGVRGRADAAGLRRHHPLSPREGSAGDALRAVRRVREGCRRGDAAGLLADRAEHADRPRRLPPGTRPSVDRGWRRPRGRPAVQHPGRRSVPRARLQRLPLMHIGVGRQRLEHGPVDRVGRTRRNLRPRRSRVRSRRPIPQRRRASSASHSTAPATGYPPSWSRPGSSRLGLQRGVPPHLTDRDAAEGLGSRPCVHSTRRPARTFDHVFTRETPATRRMGRRQAQPVPDWAMDPNAGRQGPQRASARRAGPGLIGRHEPWESTLPPELDDPNTELTPS